VGRADQAVQTFKSLPRTNAGKLPKLCLVTSELVGPFKNGGLGTSMTGLVEFVAAQGADVTVLYTGEVSGDLAEWKQKYLNAGIALKTLTEIEKPAMVGPLARIGWTNAWTVYAALRNEKFDVIHFNDTIGEGMYCFLAKRQGLAFQSTLLTLALHSPTEWILESNAHPSNWAGFCCFTTAERISIANTDLLWGPSLYLLNWLKSRDYKLPAQVFNQQYLIPSDDLFGSGSDKIQRAATPAARLANRKPDEIVFFGRLEERKGLRLFVNTISRMGPELEKRGVSVLFMGKPSSVGGVPADQFLAARSPAWKFKWRVESDFNQQQAVEYLRSNNCMAVMASPVDNSPCTVYEALRFGFPFIAARTGGIPELIHKDDQAGHLFDYTVESLTKTLTRALDKGLSNVRPSVSVAENQALWLAMHRNWKKFLAPATPKSAAGKWTVFIDHSGSAKALAKTLSSVRKAFGGLCASVTVLQRDLAPIETSDVSGIEIIDEADDRPASVIMRKLKNTAADNVIIMRSGIALDAKAEPILGRALATAADVTIPLAHLDSMNATMPMIGGSAALSMIEGDYDTGCLVFSHKRLAKLLGAGFVSLDRALPALGVAEAVHGARGEIWPLAEVLVSAEQGSDLVLPQGAEAKRAAAYAKMRHLDVYQALTIGRHYYRMIFAAAPPAPPSMVQSIVAATTKEVSELFPASGKEAAGKTLKMIFGNRSELVSRKLKNWVRGGGRA
jgi:glycosyltransferase involved in cell wall biosynthesis